MVLPGLRQSLPLGAGTRQGLRSLKGALAFIGVKTRIEAFVFGSRRVDSPQMSTATTTLLAAFESLPDQEKQQFVNEVFRRMPPYDSGPLDDAVAAQAGDEQAARLAQEEHEASER